MAGPVLGVQCVMKTTFKKAAAILLLLASAAGVLTHAATPAEAGRLKRFFPPGDGRPGLAVPHNRMAQVPDLGPDMTDGEQGFDIGLGEDGDAAVSIRPREAARIARRSLPGAKVLNVKLLPSGIYAVTLRGDGKLTRVMVDGQTGDIL